MIHTRVIYCEAFLDLVGYIEWQEHEALIIFDHRDSLNRSSLAGLGVWIVDDGEQGAVVHQDLLTLVTHLQQCVVVLSVEFLNLLSSFLIHLTQVETRLFLCSSFLLSVIGKEFL